TLSAASMTAIKGEMPKKVWRPSDGIDQGVIWEYQMRLEARKIGDSHARARCAGQREELRRSRCRAVDRARSRRGARPDLSHSHRPVRAGRDFRLSHRSWIVS